MSFLDHVEFKSHEQIAKQIKGEIKALDRLLESNENRVQGLAPGALDELRFPIL